MFNPNVDPRYVANSIVILVDKFSFIYIHGYSLLGIPLTSKCLFFYFNFRNSGNEILYRAGNNFDTRKTFQSLCPNKPVREEVYGSSESMLLYTCYKIVTTFEFVKFVIQCIADNTIHGFEGCLQSTLPH